MAQKYMRRGSDANRTRDPALAEALYWDIFRMLQEQDPSFGSGRPKGKLRRFRFRRIYALDSSTISLVHNCIDWAKHRRRKAAVKMHMLTDVPCMLPRCVVVDKAKHHDITNESPPKAPYLPGFEKILNASMGQHIA